MTPPQDWNGSFDLVVTTHVTDQALLSTGPVSDSTSISKVIPITITPANDPVVITSGAQTGSATELADGTVGENLDTHTATGVVTFSDVDALDAHTAFFTPQDSGYRGTFMVANLDFHGR
jgi:hypothetical protein